MYSHARVRVETIKNAILPVNRARRAVWVHIVLHRPNPKRSARVNSTLIQANFRPALQAKNRLVSEVGCGFPQNHTRGQDNRKYVVPICERKRSEEHTSELQSLR